MAMIKVKTFKPKKDEPKEIYINPEHIASFKEYGTHKEGEDIVIEIQLIGGETVIAIQDPYELADMINGAKK